MKNKDISINDYEYFLFDFDGVLTDNTVYVDQNGEETVKCHRSDGLAFQALTKLEKNVIIISTETSSVVSARAKKLNVPVVQGIRDKARQIDLMSSKNQIDLSKTIYVGNDINDFLAMKKCNFSACPADSHNQIIKNANYTCKRKGGEGIAREILEDLFKLDLIEILYLD
tara:strand:+ start:329 stop:838 length:510 start_codon:yes stop_codon:yes gene_type:complete